MRLALASLLCLLIGGCGPSLRELREAGIPVSGHVTGVPAFVQSEDHCGPASLAALLTWAGRPERPRDLAPLVYLPGRRGTLPIDLPREIRERGLLAYQVLPETRHLLAEVGAGHPVLVLENRSIPAAPIWHYSVLTGYDLDQGQVVLHDGGPDPVAVSLGRFAKTWRRGGAFGLLALPAGALPAAEDPEGILSALVDLEEAGKPQAAARGYESFLRRWPGDWRGAFGWGNALQSSGEIQQAEIAYRRAHDIAPGRPEPLNNLAMALLEEGRTEEAEETARMAVERAEVLGTDPAPYRETLEEVSAGTSR